MTKFISLPHLIILTVLVITSLVPTPTKSCSIFCEDGKVPCGGYGSTCEGFKGCVFPGECSVSGNNSNRPVTVPTNYDVIRPYGPNRATRRPNRPYQYSYSRPNRPSFRRTRRRYNRYFGK